MFHHNKKCFTIESLVGKDSNSSSAAADEPIRPTALRFTESIHPSPFGSCFQNSGRTLYSSSPEMMFTDPATHSTNSGLSLRHLQIPTQPFFSPHQRETLNFYPWVLRNRYLGHRFQGKDLFGYVEDGVRNWNTLFFFCRAMELRKSKKDSKEVFSSQFWFQCFILTSFQNCYRLYGDAHTSHLNIIILYRLHISYI